MPDNILTQLAETLEARKNASPDTSYVASLYAGGTEHILKKISEESVELVIAVTKDEKTAIIHEMADLWFHTLVLLIQQGIKPEEVLAQLESRFGVSGLKEKANRQK